MSNLKLFFKGKTFKEASTFLGDKDMRNAGYMTTVVRNGDGSISIVHHQTKIITYHADSETITIDCNGYRSRTTADRIRKLTPAYLVTHDGEWYIAEVISKKNEPAKFKETGFFDGIQIGNNGVPK